MIVVIIAGGSGTRLWPISTSDYPKHLLRVNGSDRSLLQDTYDRAKSLTDNIYVVPEIGHAHHVREQLSDLEEKSFVVEPARRGTASCIVAALAHVSKHHDKDEPIAFLSADHNIRDKDGFVHSFTIAKDASEASGRIVQVGVEPDYPATGFGYIKKGELFDMERWIYTVHSFKEKPDHKTAKEFLESGKYLWNCGYFVGSTNTFLKEMKAHAPTLAENYIKLVEASDEDYEKIYLGFESDAIDYALIEKLDSQLVVPASFDWMDLGSFSDLHKAADTDDSGNYLNCENVELDGVENSYIYSDDDRPVAVIGLDNIVVVNTKDGLLIARKDLSQKVGDAAKRIIKKQEKSNK